MNFRQMHLTTATLFKIVYIFLINTFTSDENLGELHLNDKEP